MKHLITILLSLPVYLLYSQACEMPSALDLIRPEKCGIRYVKGDGDRINVILEFEKKTRIITPNNPNDIKGKQVNLTGIYYLTYDRHGKIIDEDRYFVQTGEIPEKGLVFGLNGQRGEMLENELKLISLDEYTKVPWGGMVKQKPASKVITRDNSDFHFETMINVDKNLKLADLQIVKWQRENQKQDSIAVLQKKASLMEFDSADKKQYWTNQYLPVTDPAEGYTLALLNKVDKNMDKDISERMLRLVSFDSNAQIAGSHQLEFSTPMKVVYRNEIFKINSKGQQELDKQIWVLKSNEIELDAFKMAQYYYYWFDKKAQLKTSAVVVSRHQIFNVLDVFWQEEGVFYISNTAHEIVSCFINRNGKYNISTTGDRLAGLKKFIEERSGHGSGNISLKLLQQPSVLDDGSVLMVYRVQENVGVMTEVQLSPEMISATMVDHGFVAVLFNKEGLVLAADFYQRPENADPRAFVEIGPVERNGNGNISFYATDKTSAGLYPVLCTINELRISFIKSEGGPSASRHVYYDPQEEVVGYFGIKKDPNDPRISIRTLEILRAN